jgi:hypothetical protein
MRARSWWSDSELRRGSLRLKRREIGERAFGIKESTDAAFEQSIRSEAQDQIPHSCLEHTRTKERAIGVITSS